MPETHDAEPGVVDPGTAEPGLAVPAEARSEPVTYLLIDGENLDATLGMSVLGHRPAPEERPRWERVVEFTKRTWGTPVKPLFFINASSGNLPMPFLQALVAMGLRPVPLSGPPGVKVVDVGIQRMLEAIAGRDDHVMLGSHDGDFLVQVAALLGGERKVGMLAFPEFLNAQYAELAASGLEVFDLEHDAGSFNRVLPRLRIIDIDAFDPAAFL
jgi:uncharacterized protein